MKETSIKKSTVMGVSRFGWLVIRTIFIFAAQIVNFVFLLYILFDYSFNESINSIDIYLIALAFTISVLVAIITTPGFFKFIFEKNQD